MVDGGSVVCINERLVFKRVIGDLPTQRGFAVDIGFFDYFPSGKSVNISNLFGYCP